MNEARADGAVLIGGRGGMHTVQFLKKKKRFSPLPLFPRLGEPADVSGAVTFNCYKCDSDVRGFFLRRWGGRRITIWAVRFPIITPFFYVLFSEALFPPVVGLRVLLGRFVHVPRLGAGSTQKRPHSNSYSRDKSFARGRS